MRSSSTLRELLVIGAAVLAALLSAPSAVAQYVEPDVVVLQSFDGAIPGTSYGWGVADMDDIDGDGVREAIIGEPFTAGLAGHVEVRSGATGALIHQFDGQPGFGLGYSMADAGDVDGDGVHDIIAAGPYNGGRAIVYSGASGAELMFIPGVAASFGLACSGAGDVDGDGHDDVLVGAAFAPTALGVTGAAYVVSGFDGSLLRTYEGDIMGGQFGWAAALAGDLDGDGWREHMIGAPASGRAYVYSGRTGAPLLPVLDGPQTFGAYGQFFVAGVGDVDADGTDDLYVGDYADRASSGSHPAPGAAYVYSGADGSLIHRFKGKGQTTGLGPGRGAGDVDGDGHADLIVGAYSANGGAPNSGQVLIFSGRDGSVLRTITGTTANAQSGFDCVGLGDTDGDGANDYLISAASGNNVAIVAGLPETCDGDVNRDGYVDDADESIVARAQGDDYAPGDLDDDGDVDDDDLDILETLRGPC